MAPKSKSGKVFAAKKQSKAEIAQQKVTLPKTPEKKKKLGGASLDWISDTAATEAVKAQVQSSPPSDESTLQGSKLGMVKQFDGNKAEKKPEVAAASPPGFSTGSSTITKGKKAGKATKEEITVAEVTKILGEDNVAPIPESPVVAPEVKAAPAVDKPKDAGAKEAPAASAAPVEQKKAAVREDTAAKEKKVAVEEVAGKPAAAVEKAPAQKKEKEILTVELVDKKAEGEAPFIPENSSTIVKKANIGKMATVAPGKPEKAVEVKKAAAKKEALAMAGVLRAKVAEPVRKGWSRIADLGEPIKKGSRKISESVAKPFKKGKIKEAACSALDAAKQPVKAISALDRNVTRSMKKVVLFGNLDSTGKSLLNNIRVADARITQSAREMIDSIL